MKKSIKFLLFSILVALMVSGCSSDTSTEQTTQPLNEKEIEELAASKDINVIAHRKVGESFSVILFNGGFYTAYKQNGEILSRPVKYSGNSKVSVGGVSTGIPFVTVTINDKEIAKKGKTIEVQWEDGITTTEVLQNQSAVIIPYSNQNTKGEKGFSSITILDKDGKVIYKTS
ncbi:hypothetical protein [Bacillus sp. AK128]